MCRVMYVMLCHAQAALSAGNARVLDQPFHMGGSVEGVELLDGAALSLAKEWGLNAMQVQ
jgi:hypothetical protein